MPRWWVVVGKVHEAGGWDRDFAIVIAQTTEDVENWAGQFFDSYDIYPAHEFIVDLARPRRVKT